MNDQLSGDHDRSPRPYRLSLPRTAASELEVADEVMELAAPKHDAAVQQPAADDAGTIFVQSGRQQVILAPMEGVADYPMRTLLAEMGGLDFMVAEFLRISQQVPTVAHVRAHVPELATAHLPGRLPVQVQLLGGDPQRLAAAAEVAVAAGARGVDLNFGCPARTVNRHDGGASLLRDPSRLGRIVQAVRQRLPAAVPVSAKLRLGWEDPAEIEVTARAAVDGGASWLTIHARTRAQGYRPPALWDAVGRVAAKLRVPVVANGEMWSPADVARARAVTGCSQVMLGRGLVADPFLARRLAGDANLPAADDPAMAGWGQLARRLGQLAADKSPTYRLCRLKQWLRMRAVAWPTPLFAPLRTCTCWQQALALLPHDTP